MLRQWKAWLYIILLAPPASILALNSYIGFYTRLISDDYCSLYFAERLGFLRDIWFQYINFQGRYSLFAMDTVLRWIGTNGLGFVTAFVLVIWGIGIIGFLFGIQPQSREFKLKFRDATGFGLVFLAVGLLLAPNLPQSLYWWNGLATHTMPLVVFAIFLAVYSWVLRAEATLKTFIIVITGAFLISFVAGGYSETFTLGQIILLFLWLAWLAFHKDFGFRKPGTIYLLAGLGGALVALVIALISPGNAVRETQYMGTTNIFAIAQIALYHYFAFLKDIFINPEKILGVVGIFIGFFWFGQQAKFGKNLQKWEPAAILVIVGVLLTYTCFAPAAFGMSDAPPLRAQIIPDFFLLIGISTAAYLWGSQSHLALGKENLGLFAIAIVLLFVSFGIYGKQLYDSSAKYIKYARAWDENEQKIFAALKSGQETVIIHSVRNWAGLNDPGDHVNFYVNYCMSKHYGINILADNTGMQPPEP